VLLPDPDEVATPHPFDEVVGCYRPSLVAVTDSDLNDAVLGNMHTQYVDRFVGVAPAEGVGYVDRFIQRITVVGLGFAHRYVYLSSSVLLSVVNSLRNPVSTPLIHADSSDAVTCGER